MALLWLALVFVHQAWFDTPTPASRLDLLFAVVVDGKVQIDDYHDNTPDKALHRGHYYSDKAPGTAALALPAFAAMYGLQRGIGVGVEDRRAWLACSWAACAFSQALPAALGGVLLLAWLRQHVPPRTALVAVLALWLGSLPLPYSTLLFSHAQVIGLISIAVWSLRLFEDWPAIGAGSLDRPSHSAGESLAVGRGQHVSGCPQSSWWMALAGGCLGLALASEYTAGLVVLGLLVHAVVRHRRWQQVAALGAGAVPPLLLIPAYSWITLGTPFQLPYSHQASFAEMSDGLYAIQWPDLENLLRLLFGPTRGLVFWTPFLLLAASGWWWIARRRPRWLWLAYGLPLLHVVVISGRTWDWQAGYTLSARYLAPILPLVALPCALGTVRWPRLGTVLAAFSITLVSLATVTDACPIYSIGNPLTGLHLPRLIEGRFSPNLATTVFGLPPFAGVAVFGLVVAAGIMWAWRTAGGQRVLPERLTGDGPDRSASNPPLAGCADIVTAARGDGGWFGTAVRQASPRTASPATSPSTNPGCADPSSEPGPYVRWQV